MEPRPLGESSPPLTPPQQRPGLHVHSPALGRAEEACQRDSVGLGEALPRIEGKVTGEQIQGVGKL